MEVLQGPLTLFPNYLPNSMEETPILRLWGALIVDKLHLAGDAENHSIISQSSTTGLYYWLYIMPSIYTELPPPPLYRHRCLPQEGCNLDWRHQWGYQILHLMKSLGVGRSVSKSVSSRRHCKAHPPPMHPCVTHGFESTDF